MPVANTSAPPKPTWSAADSGGVSMYFQRIQEIAASSTTTTQTARMVAVRKLGSRNGSVWPMPPMVGHQPAHRPRTSGRFAPAR